jgi:hypothetical protein
MLPATPLLDELPAQSILYTARLLYNVILRRNFLLMKCSQGTNQKFWYCFRVWYVMSHISGYQYNETNVMHFLFDLLRIKGLCMFRALLVHPQEALNKLHLLYCVCVMSVGCTRTEAELVQPTDITRTQYTKCRLCSAS